MWHNECFLIESPHKIFARISWSISSDFILPLHGAVLSVKLIHSGIYNLRTRTRNMIDPVLDAMFLAPYSRAQRGRCAYEMGIRTFSRKGLMHPLSKKTGMQENGATVNRSDLVES
jgi:hypothetical protein